MTHTVKAVLTGAIALLSSVVTGLGDNTLSSQEIVTAVLAGVVAFAALYGIPTVTKMGK
jgi:uncharacterized membrane-anchored protein